MATPFRLKRSAVSGKRPGLSDLEIGELALNFYDGSLYTERDTGGVGIGTTVANLTPWKEQFSRNEVHYSGIASATTYHGDQVIGTPTGGSFRAGAYVPTIHDYTKDSIDELNYILGKLVPSQPQTIAGKTFTFDPNSRTAGWSNANWTKTGRFCAGFNPDNHTEGDYTVTAGTLIDRNTDNKFASTTITQIGPGDSGTVTGYVNNVGVGTTTLNVSFGLYAVKSDNGTYGDLIISNDIDAADATGIASEFYEVYDVRISADAGNIGYACSTGVCKSYITHGSNKSANAYWYEDPSTVGAPVVSYSGVTIPSSPEIHYSSGIPHYKNHANNAFSYVATVVNASGDMYYYQDYKVLKTEGQTTGFTDGGNKLYNQFYASGTQGTHPPQRNFGVGTGVTCTISHTPRDVHVTITGSHFTRYDCYTPYGEHLNQRVGYSTNINIMGTSGDYSSNVDEDYIECTVGSLSGGSATRVNAGTASDVGAGTSIFTTFDATTTPAVYEAIVRGGDLRHDVTDYSSASWLPTGPDLSGRTAGNAQYFQMKFVQAAVSGFKISLSGSGTLYSGCWVCMPNNATWMTNLSDTGGWANMFEAYDGAGAPRNGNKDGCGFGTLMTGSSGTYECTFGTQSSSNSTGDAVILVRLKLSNGNNAITDISFSDP